jgi:uncharacterized membrane protein
MMPDFWRKELWHPVTVHFPIALLLVATLFFVISIFKGGGSKRTIQNASFMISILGVVGAWISIYTGDMADGIVSRKICDPTILKDHELAAETMIYLQLLQLFTSCFSLIYSDRSCNEFHPSSF